MKTTTVVIPVEIELEINDDSGRWERITCNGHDFSDNGEIEEFIAKAVTLHDLNEAFTTAQEQKFTQDEMSLSKSADELEMEFANERTS